MDCSGAGSRSLPSRDCECEREKNRWLTVAARSLSSLGYEPADDLDGEVLSRFTLGCVYGDGCDSRVVMTYLTRPSTRTMGAPIGGTMMEAVTKLVGMAPLRRKKAWT